MRPAGHRFLFVLALLVGTPVLAENVHFTYLWHLEQPIYWPAQQTSGADRYERAWESILRTDGGAAHPANNLREIFSIADRVAAYQYRPKDCLGLLLGRPEAGAQVSYSGGLIENINSLGNANQLGYGPTWYNNFRTARNWTTTSGKPRMDIVLFPFHHPLLPLIDDSTIRKEIQLYKQVYASAWGASPGLSRGLFPSEMAFSERIIRALVEEGLTWVVVSNEHISRGCTNYPLVLGSGGVNCEPPNLADQLNGTQSNWLRVSISRGCSPVNAYPYAYTPHYARYVDPATGAESKIIVVPSDQSHSWQDGYAPIGLGEINTLQTQNPAARPQLVLFAHDGDNNWGGGFSYYMEAVPNFVNSASNAGYVATTVEQYLNDHPVPTNDIVHVEDGAWVNADGDFGSPSFLNWNWPLVSGGQVDPVNGWAEDERNWAVITAAQNRVDTAEQIACGGSPGCLNPAKILNPDGSTTGAERAWHYFLGALNSGYMYYGTSLDMEVKPTIACNEAMQHADPIIGNASADATPPTIWIPQRFPWNPGSLNFGPSHGYQQVTNNGDFWIWTFAYDASGISSVTLKYRLDDDTTVTDANRTYVGGAGVGVWQNVAMTQRIFPTGNVANDPSIDFFVLPTYIANEYYVQLTGIRSKLVDYYIEAVDTKGYIRKSPIQHVYVGSGEGGSGGGSRVTFTPSPAVAGQPVLISFDAVGGPIAGAAAINAHVGFNNWGIVPPDVAMTFSAGNARWEATVNVPITASQVDVAFNNGAGIWDNNGGQDWHVSATGASTPWTMDGQRDADATLAAQNGAMQLYAGVKGGLLYVASQSARNNNDHFIFVAGTPGAMQAAPWAKAGQVADWSAFLANESTNNFKGWFDAGAGVAVQSASTVNNWLEGTIDLAAELGSLPDVVYLAMVPYATADGGAAAAALQVPAGNGNGTIELAEYVAFETFRRGDLTGDWRVDLADVNGFVNVLLGTDTAPTQVRAADMTIDSIANGADVALFVSAIMNP